MPSGRKTCILGLRLIIRLVEHANQELTTGREAGAVTRLPAALAARQPLSRDPVDPPLLHDTLTARSAVTNAGSQRIAAQAVALRRGGQVVGTNSCHTGPVGPTRRRKARHGAPAGHPVVVSPQLACWRSAAPWLVTTSSPRGPRTPA